MTQTILDISLSLDGFATAANVRPEEPMGDGQGWVYVVVDDVHGHYERASRAVEILNEPHDAFDGAQRGYSARDREGNLWSFGTMSPGAKQ
jgi:uncharacterized glyoxalase superfamily protein PhnB